MNRIAGAILGPLATLALAATAGCSPRDAGTLGPAPTGSPAASPPASATATPTAGPTAQPTHPDTATTTARPPAGTIRISLWYTRGGKLAYTERTRPATVATSRLALTELAAGPSPLEASTGLTTAFPDGTAFTVVGISGGVATVTFNPGFYAGGRDAARLRQAQVVYTLTQFSSVSRVGFQSDGQPLAAPVGRADYADRLPAIVVTSPVIGQRVRSPVTVAGTADVYEATVIVRVLNAAGREVATTFTTATCGTGCRGNYRTGLAYRVTREQSGVVEVYEVSAADGAHINVVRVPVTLVP
jgi:hypothetical protein